MTATFYVGDAIKVMGTLPEKSVDLVLSSPPFLALRSYLPSDHADKPLEGGSQATPGEFIDWLLDVVEACARVLAPHGSLCFELGDTYAGSGGAGGDYNIEGIREGQPTFGGSASGLRRAARQDYGPGHGGGAADHLDNSVPTKGRGWPLAKSLSLIPESFRWAMVYGHNPFTGRTTDRWRLRNVIRWVRPNPPVGALGDKFRPATSELMVFCKSATRFFDLDAVREAHKSDPLRPGGSVSGQPRQKSLTLMSNPAGAPPLDWWNIPPGGYPGAHYAVWPPELCIKPIKAMCPDKVCRTCGEPSRRITDVSYEAHSPDTIEQQHRMARGVAASGTTVLGVDSSFKFGRATKNVSTLGFSDCSHNNWRPGLVLDPFAGSGTTLAVATGHGRDAIGIDLDARNFDLALDRVGPFILSKGEVAA